MPQNEHLRWTDVTDFSKGLWTADSGFLMPADAFQTMQDCYPKQGGGLRAFFKPTTTTVASLSSTSRVVGLCDFTSSTSTTFMALTLDLGTGALTAWSRLHTDVAWTSRKVFAAPAGGLVSNSFAQIVQYVDSSGNRYFAIGIGQLPGGGDTGIWLWNINTAVWSQIANAADAIDLPIVMYQNRLVCRANGLFGTNTRLRWTDPGGITFPAANYIDLVNVQGDHESAIAALVPYNPSNLLVAQAASGWTLMSGDISDPIVTQMGDNHAPNISHGQGVALMANGPVFLDPNSGMYVAQNNATTFNRLDPELAPYNPGVLAPLQSVFYKDFLFVPGGRVMHVPSSAWFTLSEGTGSNETDYAHALRYDSKGYGTFTSPVGVYLPQFQDSFKINRYVIDEAIAGATTGRYETFTVKTAPLREPSGRQIAVREVEVLVNSHNTAASVAVTVNGVTKTRTAIGSGKKVLPFLFGERGPYLDVQVVPNSNVTNTEAPILEGLRIGARADGHQIH